MMKNNFAVSCARWLSPALLLLLAACGSDKTEFGSHDQATSDAVIEDDAEQTANGESTNTEPSTNSSTPPIAKLEEEEGGGLPLAPSDDDCVDFEEESCTAERGCAPIHSQDDIYRGCHGDDETCIAAIQCGRDSEGVEAQFNGCMPFGWSPCDEPESPVPETGTPCESVEDCTYCGRTAAPPPEAPDQCVCPALCASTPAHVDDCSALNEAWAPRTCSGLDQALCPIAACQAPEPLACIAGKCVVVQALPNQ